MKRSRADPPSYVASQWSAQTAGDRKKPPCTVLASPTSAPSISVCQPGRGAGGNSRRSSTVVSVTTTSSGGVDPASAAGAISGATNGTWVTSAKFSCRSRKPAATSSVPPTPDHPSSVSHGSSGTRCRRARPDSPSQTQTSPSRSWTGYAATWAPKGTRGWVGTETH